MNVKNSKSLLFYHKDMAIFYFLVVDFFFLKTIAARPELVFTGDMTAEKDRREKQLPPVPGRVVYTFHFLDFSGLFFSCFRLLEPFFVEGRHPHPQPVCFLSAMFITSFLYIMTLIYIRILLCVP